MFSYPQIIDWSGRLWVPHYNSALNCDRYDMVP